MNYQNKYLKYKSKYLEKKYGRQFRFRYKIDYENDNDLDYKQKYFKYKSKYLNIKYGGDKLSRAMAARTQAIVQTNNRFTTGLSNYINPQYAIEDEKNDALIAQNKAEAKAKAKVDAPKIKAANEAKQKIADAKAKIKNKFIKILSEKTPYKEKLIKCNVASEKKWGSSIFSKEDKCPPREYNNNIILTAIEEKLEKSTYDINNKKEDILIDEILDAALNKEESNILDKDKLKKHIKSWINSWRL
jgi:hypothetical protein